MSLLGRKTSLLEDASQVLRDFQAVSEIEPARDRAQSFSRQNSSSHGDDGRRRSSTFTQMQSRHYLDRVREKRAQQDPPVPRSYIALWFNRGMGPKI